MIVIGADTHKRTHALAAVDEGTGRVRSARQIQADEAGHLAAVRWARGLDDERVWAIEDCRHVSRRFEQALIAAGERVVRVSPHRMGASRRGEREPGKSDQIDALAIARAVVKDGVERFPVSEPAPDHAPRATSSLTSPASAAAISMRSCSFGSTPASMTISSSPSTIVALILSLLIVSGRLMVRLKGPYRRSRT
jgi:transposase